MWTKKKKTKDKNTRPRALHLTLLKPLNIDWDALGKILRSVEKACINIANATVTSCLASDQKLFTSVQFSPCGLPVYRKKTNREKKEVLDLPDLEQDRTILYQDGRRRCPFVSSSIVNLVVNEAMDRYRKSRAAFLLNNEKARNYRNCSIPIHNQTWNIRKEGNSYIFTISLLSQKATEFLDGNGKPIGQIDFVIDQRKKFWSIDVPILDEIISGKRKKKELKISCNHKKKWIVFLIYDKDISDHKLNKRRVLQVYPPGPDRDGNARFLACSFFHSKERPWTEHVEFMSAMRFLQQYQHRSKLISTKYRQDKKRGGKDRVGAVGHGRKRAIKNKKEFQRKYERSTTTFNQQRAAFIVRTAIKMKCGKIQMINMVNNGVPKEYLVFETWPYYELQKWIRDGCETNRIDFELVDFNAHKEFLAQRKEKNDGDGTC